MHFATHFWKFIVITFLLRFDVIIYEETKTIFLCTKQMDCNEIVQIWRHSNMLFIICIYKLPWGVYDLFFMDLFSYFSLNCFVKNSTNNRTFHNTQLKYSMLIMKKNHIKVLLPYIWILGFLIIMQLEI